MGKRVQFVLKLFSYDSELLAAAAEKVIAVGLTELSVDSVISGPISLPNIIRRWCLLKSPHVYKDSREHFSLTQHRRLFELIIEPDSTDTFGSVLSKFDLPHGVRFGLSGHIGPIKRD
mgnify:FL=1